MTHPLRFRIEASVPVGAILVGGLTVAALVSLFGFELEGGALAVVAVGPVFWLLDRHLNPALLVGPAVHTYVYHLLAYAIGPLGQRYFSVLGEGFREHGMILAQRGAVGGLLAFAALYPVFFRMAERLALPSRTSPPTTKAQWEGYTVVLVLVGLAIAFYAHWTSAFRRLGDFETPNVEVQTAAGAFAYVQQIAFFFIALVAARRRTITAYVIWAVAVSIYAAYTFLEGTRGLALTSIILSSLGLVLGGLSKKKVIPIFAAFITVFIPLTAIIDHYRGNSEYNSRYDEGFGGRIEAFYGAAVDFDNQRRMERTSTLDVFFRAVSAGTVDTIMEYSPDRVPFAGWRDLDRILYVWIPRILDPDRPMSDGNEIANEYGVGHDGHRSWVHTPAVGEGYRRFGWIGIPLFYAMLGASFGFLTGLCWARRRYREWAALLIFCFATAPIAWLATFLSAAHHIAWDYPKFFVLFYVLRRVQDSVAHILRGVGRETTRVAPGIRPQTDASPTAG